MRTGAARPIAITPWATKPGPASGEAGRGCNPDFRRSSSTLFEFAPPDGLNVLKGRIANRVFLGEVVDYVVDVGGRDLRARLRNDDFRVGQAVNIEISPQKSVGLPG
jgi:TOBE domain-containing protein